jgi:Tfp pilus assembly protein PilF
MKQFLLVLGLLVVTVSCFGQSRIDSLLNKWEELTQNRQVPERGKIDSLVQVGIQYHDKGEYDKAIETYREALRIDSTSALVNAELAMTYGATGDNENAIRHSDFVIKQGKGNLLPAYITKGSALDDLGKTEQAIEVFREAVAQFGDNYLLYFNLAVSYGRIQDLENAEQAYINAIMDEPNHASSHCGLAVIKAAQHQRVQSLLSLYFFLLLEPESDRAKTAYTLLMEQLRGNGKKDGNNPMDTGSSSNPEADAEFCAAEIMLGILEASNSSEENKGKTPEELFIQTTQMFFTTLGEQLRGHEGQSSIWWSLYVHSFYELAQSEYMDVFCYYISLFSNEKAGEWLMTNREKFEQFAKWIIEKSTKWQE